MRNAEKLLIAKEGLTRINSRMKKQFFDNCLPENSLDVIAKNAKATAMSIPPVFTTKGIIRAMDRETYNYAARSLLACGLAIRALRRATTLSDYMANYATYKVKAFQKLSDYGAFGDLVETICHIAVKGYFKRVNLNNVHVSDIGKIDFTFCGKKIECGINGKTWREGTPDNFSNGNYDSVVYGMFSPELIAEIVADIRGYNLQAAINCVLRNLYYFSDKKDFFAFMASAGKKSALVQWKDKPGIVQSIYNDSTAKAFKEKVTKAAPTFYDIIRERYPHSDILND